MIVAGVHLEQHLGRAAGASRSAVAVVSADGRLTALEVVGGDAEVLAAVPRSVRLVVVDAPLAVPAGPGRRDAEAVLAWCDHTAFPVSRTRLEKVFGGARGVALAPSLAAGGAAVAEALPDLVLRELDWEREHPPDAAPLPLADYRALWLGVRAPAFRPRGGGRAQPDGVRAAHALLRGALDLGGWVPEDGDDDWAAIRDAARLDAVACAYAGLRHLRGAGSVALGDPERGLVLVPADANLRARIALHVDRLRGTGEVAIPRVDPVGPAGASGDTARVPGAPGDEGPTNGEG